MMERPLSALERRMFLLSRGVIGNGVLCARIHGSLDEARLRPALDALTRRHPLLAARVARTHGLLTLTSDGTKPLGLRVVSADGSDDQWRAVTAAEQVTPFDLATGPLWRAVLIYRPGGERADLVMALHHIVGDATALCSVLRDVLTFAALPETVVEPLPPLVPMSPAPGIAPSLPAALPDAMRPSPAALSASPSDIAITTARLGPGPVQALARHCREQGVTMHAAICAAVGPPLAALFAGKRTVTISSPVSYRHCLPQDHAERALGNFLTTAEISMDCSASRPLWERARAIYRLLSEQTADEEVLRAVSSFETVSQEYTDDEAFLRRTGQNTARYDISISNIGRQPLPTRYGELTIEAMHGGSCLPGELILFLVTLDGTMHLTLMSNRLSATANDNARRVLASALEQLSAHAVAGGDGDRTAGAESKENGEEHEHGDG